ncbi:MAG: diadenylate cyclase CdaA [Paludibacteraceae bacterium]|nr:diadenylate cyclase CdaA [Paludibacteraceae bacterium]
MIEFRLKDFFDILIVALLLYQTYKLLKGTTGMNIFALLVSFISVWFLVSFVFQMELLGSILNKVANVGVILLVILYQDEIRNFLSTLGSRYANNLYARIKRALLSKRDAQPLQEINEIVEAMVACAKTKTGALVVIQKEGDLTTYCQTGEIIESNIKARLIENIFFKNTPLHDGALIIVENQIKSVGCILPISHKRDLPKELGLRHRAALGITEKTDAYVIVVSEETGRISCMRQGEMLLGVTKERLTEWLSN